MTIRQFVASRESRLRVIFMPLLLALLGIVAGCSNNNNNPTGPHSVQYQNFAFHTGELNQNLNQRMEVRVVSNASDSTVALAIIDPLVPNDTAFVMPGALQIGQAYHADIWIDRNGSGTYDTPPVDGAWRLTIPANGSLNFTNSDSNFTDIGATGLSSGQALTVNLTGLNPTATGYMEMRVIDSTTGRTVGLYRHGGTISSNFTVTIPGVIQNGSAYRIDFFNDLNGNGQYDPPPTDQAWRVNGTGTSTGLTMTFAASNNFTDVGF